MARLRERLQHPDWGKLAPLLLVALAVGFNLYVLRGELARVADVNDTGVHISMVRWAQHRFESGAAPVRRVVPAPRARAPPVPPLPEPPPHHRRGARHRLRSRAHGDVDVLPRSLPLADLHVRHHAPVPVQPLDRRLHRAARADDLVGHPLRLRARQLHVAGQRRLVAALGHVAVPARARALVARGVARQGLRDRRARGRAHHRVPLPDRIPRPALARHLGDHRAVAVPEAPRARSCGRRRRRARCRVGGGAAPRGQQLCGAHRVQRRHLLGQLPRRPAGDGVALHRRAVRPRPLGDPQPARGRRRGRGRRPLPPGRARPRHPHLHRHRDPAVLRARHDRLRDRPHARRQGPPAPPVHHPGPPRRPDARRDRHFVAGEAGVRGRHRLEAEVVARARRRGPARDRCGAPLPRLARARRLRRRGGERDQDPAPGRRGLRQGLHRARPAGRVLRRRPDLRRLRGRWEHRGRRLREGLRVPARRGRRRGRLHPPHPEPERRHRDALRPDEPGALRPLQRPLRPHPDRHGAAGEGDEDRHPRRLDVVGGADERLPARRRHDAGDRRRPHEPRPAGERLPRLERTRRRQGPGDRVRRRPRRGPDRGHRRAGDRIAGRRLRAVRAARRRGVRRHRGRDPTPRS